MPLLATSQPRSDWIQAPLDRVTRDLLMWRLEVRSWEVGGAPFRLHYGYRIKADIIKYTGQIGLKLGFKRKRPIIKQFGRYIWYTLVQSVHAP
jgi:hypothetical protein